MKIICTEEEKKRLIEESEYLHYFKFDDKINILMYLYQAPEEIWVIEKGVKESQSSKEIKKKYIKKPVSDLMEDLINV